MNSDVRRVEAVVIGAGPAGMALAVALVEAGVETLCVAPAFEAWVPTYGVWPDQLAELDLEPHYGRVWPNVRVSTPLSSPRIFERPYAKLDNAALFSAWFSRLRGENATHVDTVLSVFFDGSGAHLDLQSGGQVVAERVFDASGHWSKWVKDNPMSIAYQTAFGVEISANTRTMSGSTMGLMEWHDGIVIDASHARRPAFYYVMPESDKTAFRELTVLASRPMVDVELLQSRFEKEEGSINIENKKHERCVIPMGDSIPALDQQIVGFGAAASMVHPATGYMVERCLRVAPEIAEAVVALRGVEHQRASRDLWEVVWPRERARAHELFRFGLEVLLQLSPEETWAFFEAFFSLPQRRWSAYLSGTVGPGEIARIMLGVFSEAELSLRRRMVGTALSGESVKLVRGLLPGSL